MYNEKNCNYIEHTSQSESSVPPRRIKRRGGFFKRAVGFAVCAALFGGIAGGSFYGVNLLLENAGGASGDTRTVGTAAANVSYTSGTGSQSLDVSAIAAQGLTSVVSVTNISVQEVQSYFGIFGRGGRRRFVAARQHHDGRQQQGKKDKYTLHRR